MEKMWMRSVVTLALCLSISACGKSKDDKSSSSPAPAPAKTTTSTLPQTPTAAPAPAAGTPQAPQKDGAPQTDLKGNPVTGPQDSTKPRRLQEKQGGSETTRSSRSHGSSSSSDSRVSSAPGSSSSSSGPSIAINEFDGNRYSGAAADNLREYLTIAQDEDNSISAQQKARNQKFARSIKKASLRLNTQTGLVQIILSLTSQKSGKAVEIGVTGSAREGQAAFNLTSKSKGLSGKLMCLDTLTEAGQSCQTSLGEVRYNGDRVQVIFRHTPVDISFNFPDHNCLSKECSEIYNLARYSERKIIDSNTVKLAVMDTFEVVQGKSEFRVLVVTNENEVMKFAGPLANPELYPVLDTPVDQSLTAEDLRDPKTQEPRRSRLNEALHDVRITTNDGLGNLNLLVKMKILDDGNRDMFQIYLKRQVRQIQIPSENSLK